MFNLRLQPIIFCLVFSLLHLFIYAQNANSSDVLNGKLTVITIDSGNGVTKFFILKEVINIKCDKDVYYAWYANNKFNETQGGYHGRLIQGLFKSFYKNANLQSMGYYHNGIKKGEWKTWYENGNLKEVLNWKNGSKNGNYLLYNEYGQKMVEANFKNNVLHGKFLSYVNNKIASVKQYKNGEEVVPILKTKKAHKLKSDTLSNTVIAPVY